VGQRQVAQIPPAYPEGVEGGVVEITPPFQQGAEILATLRIERDDFPIQDHLLDRKLLADPMTEILESAEQVAALGSEVTVAAGDVEEAAESVVLGLEHPGGVVERPLQSLGNDRLDQRQDRRRAA
jgi:hypothetical protein